MSGVGIRGLGVEAMVRWGGWMGVRWMGGREGSDGMERCVWFLRGVARVLVFSDVECAVQLR